MRSHIVLLAVLALSAVCVHAVTNVKASTKPPGGLAAKDTPLFIVVTTDDDCASYNGKGMQDMLRGVKNPNGCSAAGTFYCMSEASTCNAMKRLNSLGHEIATHTMTHPKLTSLSKSGQKKEIVGARQFAIDCGVPAKQVKGFRCTYLECNKATREILQANGFLYDGSLAELWSSPSSPSGKELVFPYSMYQGIVTKYADKWFGGMGGVTKDETHDKLFSFPLYMYQDGSESPATNDLMDPIPAYSTLKAEFDRRYAGNHAPLGVWGHWWNYFEKQSVRDDVKKFLNYAVGHNGVYVVPVRVVIDWMQNPVPISQMNDFMSKYTCNKDVAY